MKTSEIKNDLKNICKRFNLGKLRGFETKKHISVANYQTAFFTTLNSTKIYEYHFIKN